MKMHRQAVLAAVFVAVATLLTQAAPAVATDGRIVTLQGTLRGVHSDDFARAHSTLAYQLVRRALRSSISSWLGGTSDR